MIDVFSKMLDVDALAAELRAELLAGGLTGLGPIPLGTGNFPDVELVGNILLADLDHLHHLLELTGNEAVPGRWARVTEDLHILVDACRARRDRRRRRRGADGVRRPT